MKHSRIKLVRTIVLALVVFAFGIAETTTLAADASNQALRETGGSLPGAKNTVVRLLTHLGVKKEIPINRIDADDWVISHLLGAWNMVEANFVLKTEEGVYLVIPQELFRLAEIEKGAPIVKLSNGKQFEGNLVGTIHEGETAEISSRMNALNVYPLCDCTKVELVSIDGAYLNDKAEKPSRHSGDALNTGTHWKVFLRDND